MWVNLCPVIYLHVVNHSGNRHGWPALWPGLRALTLWLHLIQCKHHYAGAVSTMKRREATQPAIRALRLLDPGSLFTQFYWAITGKSNSTDFATSEWCLIHIHISIDNTVKIMITGTHKVICLCDGKSQEYSAVLLTAVTKTQVRSSGTSLS